MYNPSNIFAKILRHELPCDKLYEDDYCLAFHDKHPQSPVHVLVIPKKDCIDWIQFTKDVSSHDQFMFYQGVLKTINVLGIQDFTLKTHNGSSSGQEIYHFHVHILA
jgi:histidine triad (HIT) family protein